MPGREFTPRPKPQPRILDPAAGLTRLRATRFCPLCGNDLHYWPGASRHHMVPKGQGGDDVEENVVVICGSGTTGCHGKITSKPRDWKATAGMLRRHLEHMRPEVIEYCVAKKSLPWLDRQYPG